MEFSFITQYLNDHRNFTDNIFFFLSIFNCNNFSLNRNFSIVFTNSCLSQKMVNLGNIQKIMTHSIFSFSRMSGMKKSSRNGDTLLNGSSSVYSLKANHDCENPHNQDISQPIKNNQNPKSSSRQKFLEEEDNLLLLLVKKYGARHWNKIAKLMPNRTGRQCRDRYANYLEKHLTNDPWTPKEDKLLIEKVREFGTHWSVITSFFVGRSANNIKNRWYSYHAKSKIAKKYLKNMPHRAVNKAANDYSSLGNVANSTDNSNSIPKQNPNFVSNFHNLNFEKDNLKFENHQFESPKREKFNGLFNPIGDCSNLSICQFGQSELLQSGIHDFYYQQNCSAFDSNQIVNMNGVHNSPIANPNMVVQQRSFDYLSMNNSNIHNFYPCCYTDNVNCLNSNLNLRTCQVENDQYMQQMIKTVNENKEKKKQLFPMLPFNGNYLEIPDLLLVK
ncbi:hypothetical protein TRFO_40716 [Tritrichomonas foetus]|uniref:Myb-like DNA-binding domain containing protein n=1 Tax=Tritrichomonas foetus TaxID=1144522 RepID=A0A1J4J5M0_9EUKA|nr:hypothetical protein TRFO_40716 [Tritrichomonas foetus]|eukprot:OHS92939.1 hypothetical protein TRFO_40716 [Tritrichomonas foetus]